MTLYVKSRVKLHNLVMRFSASNHENRLIEKQFIAVNDRYAERL